MASAINEAKLLYPHLPYSSLANLCKWPRFIYLRALTGAKCGCADHTILRRKFSPQVVAHPFHVHPLTWRRGASTDEPADTFSRSHQSVR